jgi:hypothetical protein
VLQFICELAGRTAYTHSKARGVIDLAASTGIDFRVACTVRTEEVPIVLFELHAGCARFQIDAISLGCATVLADFANHSPFGSVLEIVFLA